MARIRYCGFRHRAGAEPGVMDALRRKRGEEALHGGTVRAIAAWAHELLDPVSRQHSPIRTRGVLHAAMAVVDQPARRPATLKGYHQGVDAHSRVEMISHRPADNLARSRSLRAARSEGPRRSERMSGGQPSRSLRNEQLDGRSFAAWPVVLPPIRIAGQVHAIARPTMNERSTRAA